MNIEGIKSWLDESISLIENNPPDTVPIRIEQNRKKWGIPFRQREEIKAWVVVNKPKALPYLAELKNWLEEYYHYFDTGYKSPHSIDELPGMILERLKFIRTKIESL